MRGFFYVSVATLIWGNSAVASLATVDADISGDREMISSWTAQLNQKYPALQVSVPCSSADASAVADELGLLQDDLQGMSPLPRNLVTLACNRPECIGAKPPPPTCDGGKDGREP